jgi:myosin heavy subunit
MSQLLDLPKQLRNTSLSVNPTILQLFLLTTLPLSVPALGKEQYSQLQSNHEEMKAQLEKKIECLEEEKLGLRQNIQDINTVKEQLTTLKDEHITLLNQFHQQAVTVGALEVSTQQIQQLKETVKEKESRREQWIVERRELDETVLMLRQQLAETTHQYSLLQQKMNEQREESEKRIKQFQSDNELSFQKQRDELQHHFKIKTTEWQNELDSLRNISIPLRSKADEQLINQLDSHINELQSFNQGLSHQNEENLKLHRVGEEMITNLKSELEKRVQESSESTLLLKEQKDSLNQLKLQLSTLSSYICHTLL